MGSARLVVFGDTHLGFDTPIRPRTERRRRGDDFWQNFERVLDYAAAGPADVLVHCGDFFHRSRVHPSVVERAFERLTRVADAGIPVLIVPGNHDRSRLPPSIWLGHANIHVFDRPKTVSLSVRGHRLAFAGFPFAWSDLRSSIPALIDQTGLVGSGAESAFLCMHHTVAGATVGPNGFTFRSGKDVVPRSHLPGHVAAVLSGHIHRHQVLEGDHPTVFYPGSTERTSFAERHEAKGFLDLTVSDGAVTDWRFVELPARPMVDLEVPACLGASELPGFLAERAAGLPADAIVRVSGLSEPGLGATANAGLLRSVFPPSVNVQVNWQEFARGRE